MLSKSGKNFEKDFLTKVNSKKIRWHIIKGGTKPPRNTRNHQKPPTFLRHQPKPAIKFNKIIPLPNLARFGPKS